MRAVLLALVVLIAIGGRVGSQAGLPTRVEAARKLIGAGDLAGGIAILKEAAAASPKSFPVRLELGRALDLAGRHDAARVHLEEALALAADEERNSALTALGISYAFESRADDAARYYQRAFDALVQADDPRGAAAVANALGRIYLESGNLERAAQWYTTGHETAGEIPGLSPQESALWDMRRHHALGRIAARRGDAAAARTHAAAVEALLRRGGNEGQRIFHPYLLGYIAFHLKDYRGALEALQKGDQADPFVLGLLAQAHERLGNRQAAAEYYRKVMQVHAHSINSAFSRPRARAFLE